MFDARDQQARNARAARVVAVIAVVALVVLGLGIGIRNTAGLDQLDHTNDARAQKRSAQEACAQKINAEWNSAFGQAAVSPVGSPERAYWAAQALQKRAQLDAIDQVCFGQEATTTLTVPTVPPTVAPTTVGPSRQPG